MSQKLSQKFELKVADLRAVCDHNVFKFKNTTEIKPLDEIIGQKRAVQALEFGLNMNHSGYNIFVTGLAGTGKSTIIKDYVTKHAAKLTRPNDWCLVNNFKDEFRPLAVEVPAGKAISLSREVINAARKRRFHVYQVTTVEEGIQILTGTPAGKADNNGNFSPGTVYAAVQQKLRHYFKRSLELKKE